MSILNKSYYSVFIFYNIMEYKNIDFYSGQVKSKTLLRSKERTNIKSF